MKAQTVRDYLSVHTWTGILSGMLLFVAFYAGGLAMFEPEIAQWARAETPRAAAGPSADALAARFLADGEVPARATLVLPGDANVAPYMRYEVEGRTHRVELDAAGGLRAFDGNDTAAGDFVDNLHRKGGLPLPLELAEPVIGIVALVYAVALISGVVVLVPSLIKDLFVLRITRNVKRMWLDAHNLIGIGSLPFHIVMALSAAVFGLHDWIYDTQDRLIYPQGLAAVIAEAAPKRTPVTPDTTAWLAPSQLVERVKQVAPDFQPVDLAYRGLGTPKAAVFIAGTDDRHFKRSARVGYALVDPASGELLTTSYLPGQQSSTWAALLASFFSLHFGSYGGEPLRVLYAVLGVAGALLFYTGNVLWIESRSKRTRAGDAVQRPRHVRWVASLNVGVCTGCIAGLSAAIVATRWLAAAPLDPEVVVHGTYYLVFAGCVAFAFRRGAAGSAFGLLAAAALATALIPATSLVAAAAPHAWVAAIAKPYAPGFVFVDALSFAGAALLALLAVQARRRHHATGGAVPAARPDFSTRSPQQQ